MGYANDPRVRTTGTIGDELDHVLMIVGVAEAVDVDAYVLTGAIDGTTIRGERLVEARHRAHGLRILVTMDALFRDWPRNGGAGH